EHNDPLDGLRTRAFLWLDCIGECEYATFAAHLHLLCGCPRRKLHGSSCVLLPVDRQHDLTSLWFAGGAANRHVQHARIALAQGHAIDIDIVACVTTHVVYHELCAGRRFEVGKTQRTAGTLEVRHEVQHHGRTRRAQPLFRAAHHGTEIEALAPWCQRRESCT